MGLILPKESLPEYLLEISKSLPVYAPVESEGVVKFGMYSWGDKLEFDYETTTMPPKFLFLPHGERLLEFRGDRMEESAADGRFVVFMNIIDAQALSILDEAFAGKFKDNYYFRRRESSIVAAIQNNVRMKNSFCDELDQKNRERFDLLLIDRGDCYLLEAKTQKGAALLKSGFVSKAAKKEKPKSKRKSKKLNIQKISSFLDKGPEQGMWHALADECFACGICAYVCPICHCFDVEDTVTLGASGSRCRNWDSCMLADFAAVAGGGNFRSRRHERIHNWYHHKFSRAVSERGRPDCVGCGRCITFCPAKIRIHDRIRECEEAK